MRTGSVAQSVGLAGLTAAAAGFRPAPLPAPVESVDTPPPPPNDDKPKEGPNGSVGKVAGKVGTVFDVLIKVPKAIAFIPTFFRFALLDAVLPLIQIATSMGGILAFAGLGTAGACEAFEGVKEKDGVKVLSGSADVSRGMFLGSLTATHYVGHWGPAVANIGIGFAHAILNLASGATRARRGFRRNDWSEKAVGLLEAGMAGCTVAAIHGVALAPVIVLQSGLAAARFGILYRQELKQWGQRVGQRGSQIWDDFKNLFRKEDDKSPPAA